MGSIGWGAITFTEDVFLISAMTLILIYSGVMAKNPLLHSSR